MGRRPKYLRLTTSGSFSLSTGRQANDCRKWLSDDRTTIAVSRGADGCNGGNRRGRPGLSIRGITLAVGEELRDRRAFRTGAGGRTWNPRPQERDPDRFRSRRIV